MRNGVVELGLMNAHCKQVTNATEYEDETCTNLAFVFRQILTISREDEEHFQSVASTP